MKLMTDNEIQKLSKEEILKEMSGVHHKPNQDSTTEDLRLQLDLYSVLGAWPCGMTTRQSYSKDIFSLLSGLFTIQLCFTVKRNAKHLDYQFAGANRTAYDTHDCT